ncbi:MAG: adenylate/guanylate cyclase domain-containing protein [Candidatus Bathyarchaeia archaeon]
MAAIMFTDMVGYTALGQRNESLSLALVEEQRKLIRPILARHNGREVKTIGDAFLVEFLSALDAVRCAYDIQRAVREFNISLPEERRVHLRVGVHLGDVVESEGDISGDAVNVASRIEPLAEDGGVCVTRQVYDHVQNKFELKLASLGVKPLKNVSIPIEVYRMVMPWSVETSIPSVQLDKRRIAVLPFTNMSSNPEEGYFADGMTEELITSLSGVRQLTVIARTSVMGYKGTTKKVREIGRELEVGSVLEGSVRKAGSKVRITAQLIDAATEGHLWAQNYDRQLEDVFAIQSEIAEKVAGELRIRLVDSEKRTLEKKPTENIEAYTCFLRGRELFREETEASLRQALVLFEKAVELDPRFARAYVGVAECHQQLAVAGYEPFDVSLSIVKTSLERAINLDPNLPEAHASLSEMFFNVDDMPGMEAEARRALDLNPSLPEPYSMLSELAAMNGDPGEMARQNETAYRLDPIRPRFIYAVGSAYLWTGREEEALELWKKTEQIAPAGTYRGMTGYYLAKGDLEKAKEFNAKAEKLEPTNPRVTWLGGVIAALEGDRERALLAVRKIEDAKMGPIGFNYIGYVYHALGDLDSYFEYMNKALETHALTPSTMMYSPLFARARADPRYPEFVERLRKQNGLTK